MSKKNKHKQNTRKILIILIVIALVAGAGIGVYFALNSSNNKKQSSSSSSSTSSSVPIIEEGINIYFQELGNKYNGDSIYIKAGDTDILIDAGSKATSADTISAFINRYCTDNKLEYVIATHAHEDHISGFVGTTAVPGIFDRYKIDTLIDFVKTNSTSKTYNNYVTKRDEKVASGDISHHYNAKQCIEGSDGAKKTYLVSDRVTMTILDQRYYEDNTTDENNYSVCTLFSQGNEHYLFTGDLEASGEKSLVEKNTLPKCILFKAGHHGSYTANTDNLLSVIKPEIVCVSCCAGSTEYTSDKNRTFPAQDSINRLALYTEQIYVTTMSVDGSDTYKSFNGTIHFASDANNHTITGSDNSTILKDTEWFKNNREWPKDATP